MKIATYNVNGIKSRLSNLLTWLERERPNIACIQELKGPDAAFPAIARAGYPPSPNSLKASLGPLTDRGSLVTASMLSDVERRGRTGADHVLGICWGVAGVR